MAKFDKISALSVIRTTGMVPVFYHRDIDVSKNVLKACYDGGVRAFEFTNRGDFAHEVFGELMKFARRECPDMVLGAGSIVDAGTASLYIQMGADFIVGPLFNPDVAKVCHRRCVPYAPGCGTVSEIGFAQEAGCELIKIFPAGDVGGSSFVKNVLAPMPWTMLMVTGAVEPTRENLTGWAQAGVAAVGMGSKLFPKREISSGDWNSITDRCRDSLAFISQAREQMQ